MTVTVSLFAISLLVFFVNTILDHLFNWGFRKAEESDGATMGLALLYTIKIVLIIAFLYSLTNSNLQK